MSETSNAKTLKLLAESKQKSQQIEASFKQSINESVKNASIDWRNALKNVVAQIDSLTKDFVQNSQNLSSEQIKQAQSQINLLIQQLNVLSQSVAQQLQAISNQIEITKTTVISDLQALGQTVSHESEKSAQHHQNRQEQLRDDIDQQHHQTCELVETTIQKEQMLIQKMVKRYSRIGMQMGVMLGALIMVLFILALFNYHQYNQLQQTRQQIAQSQSQLKTLNQLNYRTPIQNQVLSLIDIQALANGGISIASKIPKNASCQQNGFGYQTLYIIQNPYYHP